MTLRKLQTLLGQIHRLSTCGACQDEKCIDRACGIKAAIAHSGLNLEVDYNDKTGTFKLKKVARIRI